MRCSKNQRLAQRLKPVSRDPRALGQRAMHSRWAPLESLAHLMIADPTADAFRTVANITGI
jgi:hypothetical protein